MKFNDIVDLTKLPDKVIANLDTLLQILIDDSKGEGYSAREIMSTCKKVFVTNDKNENLLLAGILAQSGVTEIEEINNSVNMNRQRINAAGLIFDSFKNEKIRQQKRLKKDKRKSNLEYFKLSGDVIYRWVTIFIFLFSILNYFDNKRNERLILKQKKIIDTLIQKTKLL